MIIYFVGGKLNDLYEEIDHNVLLYFYEDEVYMNTFHKNEFKYMGRKNEVSRLQGKCKHCD